MNTYHKHAKEWAVRSGAIMEDIITNFEFKNARRSGCVRPAHRSG